MHDEIIILLINYYAIHAYNITQPQTFLKVKLTRILLVVMTSCLMGQTMLCITLDQVELCILTGMFLFLVGQKIMTGSRTRILKCSLIFSFFFLDITDINTYFNLVIIEYCEETFHETLMKYAHTFHARLVICFDFENVHDSNLEGKWSHLMH